jgi:copper chaperone CopZ
MSRREEEFKHRTSIFEGAYRAWSHLGGIDPLVLFLEKKSSKDLDPITYALVNDSRASNKKSKATNDDGSARLEYAYEPLPRSGLSHPFILTILSPWLGPNADKDAVELGLATLRAWWQHRRKGENKTAINILGTAKMRVIVDKYTCHFFDLAHCLVVNDNAQPPRTLHLKLKQLQKERRGNMSDDNGLSALNASSDPDLTPLEKMHAAHKHHFAGMSSTDLTALPLINVKGKCLPGKLDLPGMVDTLNRYANQLAHRGGLSAANEAPQQKGSSVESLYGDPNTTPVVFLTNKNENLIVLEVDGITCAHCVKIVETVLKGCLGGNSPISGLLDAAADRGLSVVIIHIDSAKNAKRVAFEAARNLALVGYTAKPKEVSLACDDNERSTKEDLNKIVARLAKKNPCDYFDFAAPCACPESNIFRDNCLRHSQMDERMFNAFATHERRVVDYVKSKSRAVTPNTAGKLPGPINQGIASQGMTLEYQLPEPVQAMALEEPAYDFEPIPLNIMSSSHRSAFNPAMGDDMSAPRWSFRNTTRRRGSSRAMSWNRMSGTSALAIMEALDGLDEEFDCTNLGTERDFQS